MCVSLKHKIISTEGGLNRFFPELQGGTHSFSITVYLHHGAAGNLR